jgi:hypothetical protein
LATSAAITVVGIEVGYHPSVLKPESEMVFPSDFTSVEDCIVQLSLSRSFPSEGLRSTQLAEKMTRMINDKIKGVFII